MSDTPKFTIVDRRKFRAEEESTVESQAAASPASPASSGPVSSAPVSSAPVSSGPVSSGPRLVESAPASSPKPEAMQPAVAVADEPEDFDESQLPPAPTREESRFQKSAYDSSAERLDDLVRAQNPGAPPQEKIGFEHLVQQLYLSAMMQMGAGTPEGQRPRIDILGARQTIDMLGVLEEKTRGNLTPEEIRTLDTVLFELRMTFLELTKMISAQPPVPPPPGGAKR
jgi:hypothetical protein